MTFSLEESANSSAIIIPGSWRIVLCWCSSIYQVDRQRPRENIQVSLNNCQRVTASGMISNSEPC